MKKLGNLFAGLKSARAIQFPFLLLCLALSANAQIQLPFQYTDAEGDVISYITNNGTVAIEGFFGTNSNWLIPSQINGLPVTDIESSGPSGQAYLKNVVIPGSITNIGDFAFGECQNITNVVIPNSVLNIGDYAFSGCTGLTNIVIGSNVIDIGSSAFIVCENLQNIIIPNSVVWLGSNAFASCISATNLIIGTNVSNIGDEAFDGCFGLTNIMIPDSVTNIGEQAFGDCDIITIIIPSSVVHIGDGPLAACFNLDAISVASDNPFYMSTNGVLFNKTQTTLIELPDAVTGSYSVPSSVTNVEELAFYFCNLLTSVSLSSNVISLTDSSLSSCPGLRTITVDPNNSAIESSSGVVFDKQEKNLLQFPGGFNSTYVIPNGVTNIGDDAFSYYIWRTCIGTNGSGIITPDTILRIGEGAFYGSAITNAILPDSVIDIQDNAFAACYGLTNVDIPSGVASIGNNAFSYSGLGSLDIPNTVTNLGSGAFYNCLYLTNAIVPGSVTTISDSEFAFCPRLANVTIGDGITDIGDNAFGADSSLTSITIPATVTNIDQSAFELLNLSSIFFLGNAPDAADFAFLGDPATAYYLPWTSGWGTNFDGIPAQPGSQQLFAGGTDLGADGFSFTLVWTNNPVVIVQACTNLTNPVWSPIWTNALANGVAYFNDSQWMNLPRRYYRIQSP